ncbi:MAG TPA: deoxyribonuclease V [Candidatus Methanoculleus thermohydrogenotrophicum]|jgi:deoxyribonuclease V|nr:deoxyribonuclease V [Candidatus Methanoculleus thermohydrogenotrophicum]NLM81909.1 deoxyribonuclease V [Candidatus Methanoculleus thermohydrogenotrophicum]HOB17826.1 deoxyribonuclease V [Candidatus Methanoculleus thermohydrogenotrophicum]HPZ37990.1 deoxyribonuclease V [Candidatus Methanoculleus thermohydrogenotrophicum]HQC91188.1 deoxyribonuclease V [Candidatus Methanoculleus thermohydrogenotrophicum]
MKIQETHSFDLTPAAAVRLQEALRARVRLSGDPGQISLVAGADASYTKGSDEIHAVVVVLRYPDLAIVERVSARAETLFPYIPGLLAFREGPALLEAFRGLQSEPDVIFFDGQGIAHPRGLGIASHMGVLLDRPTVGVAKSLLVGTAADPGPARGSTSPVRRDGETIGMAVRTKERTKPVYVSVGHRISLAQAVDLVLATTRGYRLPEPTRQAHLFANTVRRGGG